MLSPGSFDGRGVGCQWGGGGGLIDPSGGCRAPEGGREGLCGKRGRGSAKGSRMLGVRVVVWIGVGSERGVDAAVGELCYKTYQLVGNS